MGAAVARKLAGLDYKVAILSSSGKGEALASELGGIGVTGSNQNTDDLQRLVDAAIDQFGKIDAVVNSAGHGPKGKLLEISDEDWHLGMEVYFLNVVTNRGANDEMLTIAPRSDFASRGSKVALII